METNSYGFGIAMILFFVVVGTGWVFFIPRTIQVVLATILR
jgi:hypothetical protein